MSATATFWAWEQKQLKPIEKLVLLALANRHNKDTGKCYPSMTCMADDTGANRRSVMRAITELEKRGLITTQRYGGKSNYYHLNIGKVTFQTTSDTESPVTQWHQCQSDTSDRESPALVTESHHTSDTESPEPKRNLKDNLKDTYVDHEVINPPAQVKVPYQKIVDSYHERLPELCQVRKLTETRRRYIKNLWVGGQLDTMTNWENFFDYVSQSDFLMGRAPGRNGGKPWQADLEWITKPANYVKILEGKYSNG